MAEATVYQGRMHQLQKELMGRYYDELTRAAEGGPGQAAYMLVSGNPVELVRAFGLLPVYPEVNALQIAVRKQALPFIQKAEEMGYSIDNCAYVKADIGCFFSGRKTPFGTIPDRVMADSSGPPARPVFAGVDRAGHPFSLIIFPWGGMGGRPSADGLACTAYPGNDACASVEGMESLAPVRFDEKQLIRDSGGVGKFQGGAGQRLTLQFVADRPGTLGYVIVGYTLITLGGMAVYGRRAWVEHGEAFAVYLGLFARMSMVTRDEDGLVVPRPPLAGLARLRPRPGLLALILVALFISGLFTFALGAAHFFFPILLDFDTAIPRRAVEPLRPFRLGPIRHATTRADVYGIAWVMNHAASYTLVSIGVVDLAAFLWVGTPVGRLLAAWIAGWWVLRSLSQLYLGRRRGDRLIMAGFALLAALHGIAALV